ncbi:hypothetical protein ONE63_000491 [Megalurothrips usitatus]|uniref:Zinc finger HIT domain-containing protein 3 n=1 Tax=Megalurothrips usitatus TaxID=439358 RepID=A0AAV7Y4N9_9NEOP|nr:hypothetical protein ONE63_000491 [Megalurothrips usitatus]
MACSVCKEGLPKYKCPSCRSPYCSIPCWKTHKSDRCSKESTASVSIHTEDVNSNPKKATYLFPTADTVPPEKLQLLGDNEQLKNILSNPHVRTILTSLDNSSNPSKVLQEAMQEPIFVEFVDECMKTINPPTQEELDEALMLL